MIQLSNMQPVLGIVIESVCLSVCLCDITYNQSCYTWDLSHIITQSGLYLWISFQRPWSGLQIQNFYAIFLAMPVVCGLSVLRHWLLTFIKEYLITH